MRKFILIMAFFSCCILSTSVYAADPILTADPPSAGDGKKDSICDRLPTDSQQACKDCTGEGDEITGFWTGIGCISTSPVQAIGEVLRFMFGIGGFFVFIQIVAGAFGILVSRGNPKSVQDAREKIVNSVVALLFIIFSITILEFIGVKILSIPGFFDN